MKKKFKGEVYRAAIEKLDSSYGYACIALMKIQATGYDERFSLFYNNSTEEAWTFVTNDDHHEEYTPNTELGRRTREIALELAAHLEDIGEMDRILEQK